MSCCSSRSNTTGREVYKDDFVLILNICPNCCEKMACGSPCDCCCKCNEKCKVKGRFGLAFVAETPCSSCCSPCGWEIEIIDTPSRVEQTCRDMMKWANAPPIETGDECSCCTCCQKQGRKLRTCCCPPPPPECCCCPCPPKCCCPPKKCCCPCSPPKCCCPPKNSSCCCPPKKPQRKCCCPKQEDPCCCQGRRCSFLRGDGDETTDDMYNDEQESPVYDEDLDADGENGVADAENQDLDRLDETRSSRASMGRDNSLVRSNRPSNASQRDGHPAGSPERRSITSRGAEPSHERNSIASRDRIHSHDRGSNAPRSPEQSVEGIRSCLKKGSCNANNCPHKRSHEGGGEDFTENVPNDDRQSISHGRQSSAYDRSSLSHDDPNHHHTQSIAHDRPSIPHDDPSQHHKQSSAHDSPSISYNDPNLHHKQSSAHDRPSISHDDPNQHHKQSIAHDKSSISHDDPNQHHKESSAHDTPSVSHDDANQHHPAEHVVAYHVQGSVHHAYQPPCSIVTSTPKQPPATRTSNKKTSFFARLRSR